MKPLESAATPGVVKVISELIDDETLSSGIFENKLRSTSVCAVGVFSRRSADPASTVTVSLAPLSRIARGLHWRFPPEKQEARQRTENIYSLASQILPINLPL